MEQKGTWFKVGEALHNDFELIRKELVNHNYMSSDPIAMVEHRSELFREIKKFNADAKNYIDDTNDVLGSWSLHIQNRTQVIIPEEFEEGLVFVEFFRYGKTIKDIVDRLNYDKTGAIFDPILDGRFHYVEDKYILYKDKIIKEIKSQYLKRESLLAMVFSDRGEWVKIDDIDDYRLELLGDPTGEGDNSDVYEWTRSACRILNQEIRDKFGIDYDLLEMRDKKIRLTDSAK